MSLLRVVKPHQQVDNRGLSASRGADDAQGAALPDRKIHILQALLPGGPSEGCRVFRLVFPVSRIAERHMVKNNETFPVGFCPFFRRYHGQILLHLRRLGNAGSRSVCLGEHQEHAVQPHHAHQDHIEVGQKGQNDAGLCRTRVHAFRADKNDQRQPDVQKQRHHRSRQRHDDARLDVPPGRGIVGPAESAHLIGFL